MRTFALLAVLALPAALALLAIPAQAAPDLDGLTTVRDARSRRIASNSPDATSNGDNRWIKPGETFALADIATGGVIRHIWITFPEAAPSWISKEGCADPSELVLRMYWDGASEPAVESPLGDFFAAGFGRRAEINSVPVQVQGGDSYNCFWPMPFRKGARLTITNQSTRPLAALYYQVDYTEEAVAPQAPYFCAQYRQEFPTVRGRDYLVLDAQSEGGGHYVGTVLSVRSRSPQWFGEGDDKFYIDGEAKPSLWGTGTEDFFCNAWGMEKETFPYFGVTVLDGWLADLGNKGTMYRWNIADPVRFRSSLRVELEHAGWMSADETSTGKVEGFVERDDDFASVAFWYQRGQPKRFATLPSAEERKLPLIDRVTEGSEMVARSRCEGGALSLQPGSPWTGSGQLFFDNTRGVGAWFEFEFDSKDAAPARLVLPVTHSYDFGIYRITLDGKPLSIDELPVGEQIDFYSTKVDVPEHSLGDQALAPGPHTIRFECVGVNPASKGFKLGVDSVRVRERWNVKREPLNKKR
jgi:hypothetical protein